MEEEEQNDNDDQNIDQEYNDYDYEQEDIFLQEEQLLETIKKDISYYENRFQSYQLALQFLHKNRWIIPQNEEDKMVQEFANQNQFSFDQNSKSNNCLVCYEPFKSEKDYIELSCCHRACNKCYNDYFKEQADLEWSKQIYCRCIQDGCKLIFDRKLFDQVCSKLNLKNNYDKILLEQVTLYKQNVIRCPSQKCNLIIQCTSQRVDFKQMTINIFCQCHEYFCTKCGKQAHKPLSCEQFKIWTDRWSNNFDYGTEEFIRKNSKSCPRCKASILKDKFCLHMHCRCGFDFCWICLEEWYGNHKISFYSCDQYKEDSIACPFCKKLLTQDFQQACQTCKYCSKQFCEVCKQAFIINSFHPDKKTCLAYNDKEKNQKDFQLVQQKFEYYQNNSIEYKEAKQKFIAKYPQMIANLKNFFEIYEESTIDYSTFQQVQKYDQVISIVIQSYQALSNAYILNCFLGVEKLKLFTYQIEELKAQIQTLTCALDTNFEQCFLMEAYDKSVIDLLKLNKYFEDIKNKSDILEKTVNQYCENYEQGMQEVNFANKQDIIELENEQKQLFKQADKCEKCFCRIENPNQLNLCMEHYLEANKYYKKHYNLDIMKGLYQHIKELDDILAKEKLNTKK